MNIKDIILKKENALELTKDEIYYFVNEYTNGNITDSDMTLLLKAILKNDMTFDETFNMTDAMIKTGNVMDLSSINGIKVDKHSTGGVGDKTSLIVLPIVSSLGVKLAKLSGKGLGHTGGTIDKLDSIPGFKSYLSEEEFIKQVNEIGIVDACQTKTLVPADKKIYALRDITNTTQSIPLIASSIMSKKIASGADKILLDVKTGSGALINNLDECIKLAKLMVKIGNKYGRKTIALITDMNEPLGCSIGNSIEVKEAIDVLNLKGDLKLTKLCIIISSYMVMLGKNISFEEAKNEVINALETKKAYNKFLEFIKYQHGDLSKIKESKNKKDIYSNKEGFVFDIDEVRLAKLCLNMGSGRKNKDDIINYNVGIKIYKHINDYVKKAEILATIYYDDIDVVDDDVIDSFIISDEKNKEVKLIYALVE